MKTHTQEFKNNIKRLGRQLDSKITYTLNNEEIELGKEVLNSITPHYEGNILKSVMKQLDIDSNIEIPIGTEINYQFGVKTRSGKNLFNYEWFYENCEVHSCTKSLIENGIKLSFTAGSDAFIGEARNSTNGTTPALQAIAIKVEPNTTYTLSASSLPKCFLTYMDEDKEVVNTSYISIPSSYSETSYTFTTPSNVEYIGLRLGIQNSQYTEYQFTNIQLEEGLEATEYEQYGMYDYIDFGNYIIKESERQEDTRSYLIKCYDKMLYSMKDYEDMNITYPITIRNYINTICTHLGLSFANINDEFINYNREIKKELYLDIEGNSLNYTFRDVLDELAEVTASTIVINENDELEIRYLNNTEDTINEEYFKNINVNFGEMYGPVNTIVLSRSAGADKISISTSEDIPDDEKIAIEISDNQIMNFDDRDSYMQEILSQLAGLQYYINDFSSTGICYYDICDMYNIQIGENTYNCVMFNDEINITQGLEENIHTETPDTSEQEYKYMDTTDQRLQKVTLIVKKQEGEIEGLITDTTDVSNPDTTAGKLARVTLNVESLTNIFQITGGTNLIKNSQFLLPDKTWNFTDNGNNSKHTELGKGYDETLLGTTVSSSRIDLRNVILQSSVSNENDEIPNINNLIVGQTYTLNYYYSQEASTTTTISLITGTTTVWSKTYTGEASMENDEYQFEAIDSTYTLKIETSTTSTDEEEGYFSIYDLMLNSGDKKPWEPAQSEVASTILQMSRQGLTVKSTGAETTTLLNTDGVNIYEGETISENTKITSFNKKGIETKVIEAKEISIENYVSKSIQISGTTHHIEYFKGSD